MLYSFLCNLLEIVALKQLNWKIAVFLNMRDVVFLHLSKLLMGIFFPCSTTCMV